MLRAKPGTFLHPTTGLVTKAGVNLLTYSEQFDNVIWTKQTAVSITPNNLTSLDGKLTADRYISDGSGTTGLHQSRITTASANYTVSIFIKYLSGSYWYRLMGYDGSGNQYRVWVDIKNGIKGTATAIGTASIVDSKVTELGSGWYRISVSGSILTTALYSQLGCQTADNSTDYGTGNAYIWGAQLELGSSSTVYARTTTVATAALRIEEKGALIEKERTNLALYSEQLQHAGGWANISALTVITDDATAPDGEETADKIVPTTGGNYLYQPITVTAETTYTFSWWVKGEVTSISYAIYDQSNSGWITVETAYVPTAGWTRHSHTFETPVGCTTARVYIVRELTNTESVHVWGAQVEEGSFPSSYIPTEASAVTRNADDLTFASSEHISDTEGTVILKSDVQLSATGQYYLSFSGVKSFRSLSSGKLQCYDGTDIRDLFGFSSIVGGTDYKMGMKWWSSSVSGALDGTVSSTFGYDGSWDALTNTTIGTYTNAASGALFGHIQNLRIFDSALTDNQMIGETSW